MKKKDVLYFGSYDAKYSRNRIITKGLVANNLKVLEAGASGLMPIRYAKLTLSFLKHRNRIGSILVGFPGHLDLPLAFALGKMFKKKIFFDIFASTYETYVLDRKRVGKKSINALFFYSVDWLNLKLADYVIVDTKAHANYYQRAYKVSSKKIIVVYLGSDNDYFFPRKVIETTDVLFYGSYQPLQGADVIIKTADLLPHVNFKLVGEGQTKKEAQRLARRLKLKNVEFTSWLTLQKLSEEISKAKIILGIFGNSKKAKVVIPNKVYDGLASKKAVITSNTPATGEILINNLNSILIKPNDQRELAESIQSIMLDTNKRSLISKNAYKLYTKKLMPRHVVKEFVQIINDN